MPTTYNENITQHGLALLPQTVLRHSQGSHLYYIGLQMNKGNDDCVGSTMDR